MHHKCNESISNHYSIRSTRVFTLSMSCKRTRMSSSSLRLLCDFGIMAWFAFSNKFPTSSTSLRMIWKFSSGIEWNGGKNLVRTWWGRKWRDVWWFFVKKSVLPIQFLIRNRWSRYLIIIFWCSDGRLLRYASVLSTRFMLWDLDWK